MRTISGRANALGDYTRPRCGRGPHTCAIAYGGPRHFALVRVAPTRLGIIPDRDAGGVPTPARLRMVDRAIARLFGSRQRAWGLYQTAMREGVPTPARLRMVDHAIARLFGSRQRAWGLYQTAMREGSHAMHMADRFMIWPLQRPKICTVRYRPPEPPSHAAASPGIESMCTDVPAEVHTTPLRIGCLLPPLPPDSPDLNPIEESFSALKAHLWLHNACINSVLQIPNAEKIQRKIMEMGKDIEEKLSVLFAAS
ncbi:hypothetical protein B0H14DRAFT_3763002 [Mycena olivaceomarginata]|nr:hypothetical protein B0H14DRAFT_3763002 [Mycena olivaceomarginata]